MRGDTVLYTLEMSLFPPMAGTVQQRRFHFDGGELVLHPPPTDFGGRVFTPELPWRRAD